MKQNITQYLMVVLLVVGAYMVGVYKTKSEYLEKGQLAQVAQVAGEQAGQPEQKTEVTEEEWNKLTGAGYSYVIGDESAPVTIVEFTDYQCPFCERYYTDTYGKLKADYIETGKVRYIARDLPLPFHPNAEPAAVAARCAEEQGKGVAMHDQLFEEQESWVDLSDATDKLVSLASAVGVNQAAFRACMEGGVAKAAVGSDTALAAQVGASGTPTFVINGKMLVGAQPYAAFQSVIDAEL